MMINYFANGGRLVYFLTLTLVASVVFSADATGDDVAVVRREIAATWHGFEGINCVSLEQSVNSGGETSRSQRLVSRIGFGWRNDGRSTWSQTSDRDGVTIATDIRNDGAKRFHVHYFDTLPKDVSLIRVSASTNEPGHYNDLMFVGLWPFMPGGRTIATILDEGGTLTNTGILGATRWTLKFQFDAGTIEATLDATHQYLPREMTVTTKTRSHRIQVARFEQTDGFCYPAEGTSVITYNKQDLGQTRTSFRLEKVAMNRSSPDSRFAWTDFPQGAMVSDEVKHTNGLIGGKLARTKLLQKHPALKQSAPTNEPVRVASDPGGTRDRWSWQIMLTIAVFVGGLGIFLRRRGF